MASQVLPRRTETTIGTWGLTCCQWPISHPVVFLPWFLPPGPSSRGDTGALALAGRFSQPSLPSATVSVFIKSAGAKNVHEGLNHFSWGLGAGRRSSSLDVSTWVWAFAAITSS